jgi:hypothetical protein
MASRIMIDGSGYVGIRTTNPIDILQVANECYAYGILVVI